jgi:hypothetical protein
MSWGSRLQLVWMKQKMGKCHRHTSSWARASSPLVQSGECLHQSLLCIMLMKAGKRQLPPIRLFVVAKEAGANFITFRTILLGEAAKSNLYEQYCFLFTAGMFKIANMRYLYLGFVSMYWLVKQHKFLDIVVLPSVHSKQ